MAKLPKNNLIARIKAWENIPNNLKAGYKKPGSQKK